MPPPTGVVSGPLMAIRCRRIASKVASGNHSPACSFAFSPARISVHATWRSPPYVRVTASSNTSLAARQMSGPMPSPSMNGTIGSLGTTYLPSFHSIGVPVMVVLIVARVKPGK